MNRKLQLIQQGYLTQAQCASLLHMSTAGVAKAVAENRLRSDSVTFWSSRVIPIQEALREVRARGVSEEDFARRLQAISTQCAWGPVIEAGVFALLGLGLLYLLSRK